MTAHLNWGVLGPGHIAHSQVRDLQLVGAPVVAVASRDVERARGFAGEFGIPNHYADYDELLARADVDVVYIATTHNAHAELAVRALDAGKHVLVEKPFTVSGAEARSIADAAQRSGKVALEAMWTRFLPTMVRAREIIAAGTIGEIRTIIADHTQALTSVQRLMDPHLAGGALLDLGIYPVSFVWDLLGAPDSFVARATMTATGVDEQTSIIATYPSGAHAVS